MTTRPLRNPVRRGWLRAILFDLDGTLYRPRFLQTFMALELAAASLARPSGATACWRILLAYRRAQEELRWRPGRVGAESQLALTASRTGCDAATLRSVVDDWIFRRPLKYLRATRRAGVVPLLDFLSSRGLRAGVLSDYPAEEKLAALDLADRFDPVLCATDPAIGVLKPHPRGFLRACELWQLDPREVLVVGDRLDVDGRGAASAGMCSVIVGDGFDAGDTCNSHMSVQTMKGLHRVLYDGSR